MAMEHQEQEILSDETLDHWRQAISDELNIGLKLPLRVRYRRSARGAIIPPGEWVDELAEAHSIDADGLLFLYPEGINDAEANHDNVVQFPSPGIQYAKIEVRPYRSKFTVVKRPRDEPPQPFPQPPTTPVTAARMDANLFEGIADALQGQKRRCEVAQGLKVPREIPFGDAVWYPQMWIASIVGGKEKQTVAAEWEAAIVKAQISNNVQIHSPTKRAQFESAKTAFASALLASSPTNPPTTKSEWHHFFSAIAAIASWFVFAAHGLQQATDKFLFTFDKAFKEGFVDVISLIESHQKPEAKNGLQRRHRFNNNNNRGFRPQQQQSHHQQQQQQPKNNKA